MRRLTEADFWQRVGPPDADGCWPWQGSFMPNDYGRFKRQTYAHRYVYELFYGPIPEGVFVDHLCRFRGCVNPDHLRLVTPRESSLSSNSPTAVNARRTQCIRGHAFDRIVQGKRGCMTCHRERMARWREQRI